MARGRLITTCLALALALALVAAACGHPDSGFDMDSLRSAIPASLVPDDPAAVTDISCPAPATSEATTIVCSASIAGVAVAVTAAISADGTADISTDVTLIDLAGVAAAAEQRLNSELGVGSVVTCPGSVVVSAAGDTFGCIATDQLGIERNLIVTILDEAGAWSIDLAG